MKYAFAIIGAFFSGVFVVATGADKPPPRVTFINVGTCDETFWTVARKGIVAAARDLHVGIEILETDRSHVKILDHVRTLKQRAEKPDYILVSNEKSMAQSVLRELQGTDMRLFLLINGLTFPFANEQAETPPPYAGSLTPDNRQAGRLVVEVLLREARRLAFSRLELLALSGNRFTLAAIEREKGLREVLAETHNVQMKQLVYAEWNQNKAYTKIRVLLARYPEVNLIWAANDPMALGALRAVREAGKRPGRDILIGGINWDPEALKAVANGDMVVTVGGHYMISAWSMVAIHDMHRHILSAPFEASVPMMAVDASNIEQMLPVLNPYDFEPVDYRLFSKTETNSLPFSIADMLPIEMRKRDIHEASQ